MENSETEKDLGQNLLASEKTEDNESTTSQSQDTPNQGKGASNEFNLSWKELSFSLNKNNKEILKNTFGCAKSGQITAIIGQSGAGKTTLLNILAEITSSSAGKITGERKINGNKYSQQYLT